MTLPTVKKHRRWQVGLVVAAMITGLSAQSAFGVTVHKTKSLSLSSISFLESVTNAKLPFYAAINNNFFQKFGLTVHWINSGGQGAAGEVAAFIGGAYNFIGVGVPSLTAAVSQGGGIRAVGAFGTGSQDQLLLQQSVAANLHVPYTNVPTEALTTKQVDAQLKALKGSHITVGFTNFTANAYIGLYSAMHDLGMTLGNTSPCSADLCSTLVGTTSTQTAGFQSGKLAAIAGIPPVTGGTTGLLPGNVVIPDRVAYPEFDVPGDYIVTTPSMITQHPDTVQAVLNGFAYGMAWSLEHRKAAAQIWQSYSAQYTGVTDAASNLYQFNVAFDDWKFGPYPYKLGYDLSEHDQALTVPNTTLLPYSSWVVTRFAAAALKLKPLGYTFHA